jgi:hypothetical protein
MHTLFGNGGLFGYYGRFRTTKLGSCTWYVTDRSKAVVVVTDAKTIVLSPADTTGFLAAIGAPASAPVLSTPSGGTGIGTALVIGAVCLAAFALHFLYSPGPPSYTLTPDALTIHDRFYGVALRADAVDAGQIRVVDLNREPEWRSTWKVGGFANANYQSGRFKVANGKTVRLYRAGGDQLVLLPGKGAELTVLYQAQDPEKFAAEVHQEWLR